MSGCAGYDAIAHVYEKLNSEIDYSKWADFIERAFDKYLPNRPELVLDLACGTGTMTRELSARGYDMIGIDGSADMLTQAYMKAAESESAKPILYLNQDMREFELYGTVGAVVCCLDSINYLLSDEDVKKTFSLVHNYLDPDGLFLFDVNTPYKFENVYSDNAYILEDEMEEDFGDGETEKYAVFCGWQNQYDKQSGICDFYLSIFEENGDSYIRQDEHQQERCYTKATLNSILEESGFELLGYFADYNFGEPAENTERWYIAARAKKI